MSARTQSGLLPPEHSGSYSGAARALSKQHERERTSPSPTPPSRLSRKLTPASEYANSAGFGTGCLPYAQRDATQPQTCDGPRRDWHPEARA